MVILTFYGPIRTRVTHRPGSSMNIPLVVLAVLSLGAGFMEMPETLGGVHLFTGFINGTLPETHIAENLEHFEMPFEILSGGLTLAGIFLICFLMLHLPGLTSKIADSSFGFFLRRIWLRGWEFDRLYDWVFVKPYVFLARINRDDIIDSMYDFLAWLGRSASYGLGQTQIGLVRAYAWGIGLGAAALLGMAVLL
jgi:NADH-quinone oxidoreductase subunit L